LIDFGFCDLVSSKDSQSKRYVGSKEYTSPEILMKKPYNGFKADVWSLGVMLYVLFFADFPFDHREFIETIVTRRETPQLTFPFPISKDAETLIRSMLVLDPTQRLSMRDIVTHKWFEVKKQGRRFSLN
jgi:serine/threonine-protein kinase SIK3